MWPFKQKGRLVLVGMKNSSSFNTGTVEIYEYKEKHTYKITSTDSFTRSLLKEDAICICAIASAEWTDPQEMLETMSSFFNRSYNKWRFIYVNE